MKVFILGKLENKTSENGAHGTEEYNCIAVFIFYPPPSPLGGEMLDAFNFSELKAEENKIMKRVIKKIAKVCGTPEDFVCDYVIGAANINEGLRRMREYVKCADKIEREFNKKKVKL